MTSNIKELRDRVTALKAKTKEPPKTTADQSHYSEVPRWEIFMEQELRFGLDLGRLVVLKKRVWARL